VEVDEEVDRIQDQKDQPALGENGQCGAYGLEFLKIPNPNIQIPNKFQTSKLNDPNHILQCPEILVMGNYLLFGAWNLVFIPLTKQMT
jgi:hypothetical protein